MDASIETLDKPFGGIRLPQFFSTSIGLAISGDHMGLTATIFLSALLVVLGTSGARKLSACFQNSGNTNGFLVTCSYSSFDSDCMPDICETDICGDNESCGNPGGQDYYCIDPDFYRDFPGCAGYVCF